VIERRVRVGVAGAGNNRGKGARIGAPWPATNPKQSRREDSKVNNVVKCSCLRIENRAFEGFGSELKPLCEIYSKVEASVTVQVNEFASV
jgi:hypothetical protein